MSQYETDQLFERIQRLRQENIILQSENESLKKENDKLKDEWKKVDVLYRENIEIKAKLDEAVGQFLFNIRLFGFSAEEMDKRVFELIDSEISGLRAVYERVKKEGK